MSVDASPASATAPDRSSLPASARWALAITIGLAVGALTSLGQTHANQPWLGLVNSASPWLAGAFVAGLIQVRTGSAALAGLIASLCEVAGYYLTAHARGFPAATSEIVFWSVCGIVGGPLFGAAGWAWRYLWWPAAAAILPAAFLAESIGLYALTLHYRSTAILFAIIGVILAAILGLRARPLPQMLWWLIGLTALGIAGEWAVGQATSATFG